MRVWAVEVGCRGFQAVSMSSFFKDLGFRGSEKKKAIDRLSKTAEDASNSLWRASHFKNWKGSDTRSSSRLLTGLKTGVPPYPSKHRKGLQ